MGIALSGLASGMDTSSLISQLMEVERQPETTKQQKITKMKESQSVWKEVNSKITSFKSAVSDLKLSSAFSSKAVTSSDDTIATATASNSSSATSYVLEKVTLATSAKISSANQLTMAEGSKANVSGTSTITDANARFNSGAVSVSAGTFKLNGKTISVTATDTVNLVITKINGAGAGVTASFDKTSGQIKIEANEASSSKKIEFGDTDTSGFLNAVGLGGQIGKTISNGVSADQARTIQEVSGLSSIQTGFFTINGSTFEVDREKDTLSGLMSKINSSSAGVTAFYDSDTKKVTLTSKETGKELTLENDTSGFLSAIGVMNQSGDTSAETDKSVYKGTDAKVTINGVDFTKTSNKFTMNGVNFELKSDTDTGEKVTVNVKNDSDKTVTKIKAFIDKYNELVKYLEENTSVTTSADNETTAGVLQSDSLAKSLLTELRQKVTNTVTGVSSSYGQVSSIGIEAKDSKSNVLTVDDTKLKAALAENPDEIKKLFSQASTGTIDDEAVGGGDGTKTEFYFAKTPSTTSGMEITAGSTTYSGTSIITSGTPTAGQVLVDVDTGKMTFGTAPASGESVKASYSYDTKSSKEDGLAVRMEKYLTPYTRYNGTIQSRIKSYQTNIDDANKWIASFEDRMKLKEEALRKQYTSMETAMSNSKSQEQWLSSQLSSLS